MDTKLIKDYLNLHIISYEEDVRLSKKTWIHRGGMCKLYVTPANSTELSQLIAFLAGKNTNYLVVGCTSNIYMKNSFHIDVVISTLKCRSVEFLDNEITCECGVLVSRLAKDCVEKGISGFEYLTSLPGTIAGGIYNNSSCRENCITDNLIEVEYMDKEGKVSILSKRDLSLSFRTSVFKQKKVDGCILNARFAITKKEDSELLKKIAEKNEDNRRKILASPSKNLGCTVNRPFSLGKMNLLLRSFLFVCRKSFGLFLSQEKTDLICHRILFSITGNKQLEKYVSPKNVLTFLWLDDNADDQFENYLRFMNKYYRTDSLEIEIFN